MLLALATLAFVGTGAAQAKVPGIKTTPQYKSLNSFVVQLQSNRNTPATATKKSNYRTKLRSKGTAANTKVKSTYDQRLLIISKKDDVKQRREIKRILQGQKRDVLTLQARQIDKVNILQNKQTAAVNRATAPFESKITSLSNKRFVLEKRLAKTTKPAQRLKIQNKLTSVQKQINSLSVQAQTAANAASNRYNDRIVAVNALFKSKIAAVKTRANSAIEASKNAYKQTFRDQIDTAKDLRTNEFELVSSLRDRGTGYIDQMPPVVTP